MGFFLPKKSEIMPPLNDLLLFTAAAFIMNLSPGPANFYVMARTLAQGTSAGFSAIAGLALGSLFHVVAAVFGLSVLFNYSPVAYTLLKIVGASYLVYLGLGHFGIRFFKRKNQEEFEDSETTQEILAALDTRKIFVQSVIIEASNPKTALFPGIVTAVCCGRSRLSSASVSTAWFNRNVVSYSLRLIRCIFRRQGSNCDSREPKF